MAKGKLTTQDKFIIQGMLHNNKKVEEIAKFLGRSPQTISKYVDVELDKIHTTIASIKQSKAQKKEGKSLERIILEATVQLRENGLEESVPKLIQRAIDKFGNPPNKDVLVQQAMQMRTTQDLMVHQTAGNRKGIAVMTEAASRKIEDAKVDDDKRLPRTARKNVFSISEKRILEE